jgi:hypothetical protein
MLLVIRWVSASAASVASGTPDQVRGDEEVVFGQCYYLDFEVKVDVHKFQILN